MKDRWEHLVGLLGVVLLLVGSAQGLFVAPPDRFMGDVARIMYVHVPTAWAALLCFTFTFFVAIGWLWRGTWRWDALQEAGIEVGVVLGCLLLAQGSIWAKPTWGVWWDWDPRLTSSAVLVLAFGAILALRSFVDDPRKRATWTAVAAIIAYVDVPIVYFSVRWWRTLHQAPSSPETVDSPMVLALRLNAFALLFLATWLVARRYRLARARNTAELSDLEAA
ncbi:MAG: cytochrome c biogenesis protein CcsA [Myxococcota bacterium]